MIVALRAALRLRAQVYHVHDPELLVALLMVRLLRPRAILIQDAHENYRRYVETERPGWLRYPLAMAIAFFEYAARFYCSGFIVANPSIARNFPERLTVEISNFPSFDQLPLPSELQAERPLAQFVYAGVIYPAQRVHLIVEALGMLPEALNARLVLAGTFADDEYEKRLRSLMGWRYVDLVGRLPAAEVIALYTRSTAAVIPMETFGNMEDARPNKLFECLGSGLPVIVAYQEGWRPFIETPQAGWSLKDVTADGLARIMREVIEQPEETRRRGRNARAAIERAYNWEVEEGKLLGFYRRLTSN